MKILNTYKKLGIVLIAFILVLQINFNLKIHSVPVIHASAIQTINDETDENEKHIIATFSDEFDITNVKIDMWFLDDTQLSSVSKTKILELEDHISKQTNLHYKLKYAINVAFTRNDEIIELSSQDLTALNFLLLYDGKLSSDLLSIAYLENNKSGQWRMEATDEQKISLIMNASSSNLKMYEGVISESDKDLMFNLSIDTSLDGVYLIFQLNEKDITPLVIMTGVAICIVIAILLVVMIYRYFRIKRIRESQKNINKDDGYIVGNSLVTLDKAKIKEKKIVRKIFDVNNQNSSDKQQKLRKNNSISKSKGEK